MSDITLKMLLIGEDRGASKALSDVGDSAEKTRRSSDNLAESTDNLDSKMSGATSALGALSSGFELVGLDGFAEGLGQVSMATDFFSGAGEAMTLILESEAIATARAKVAMVGHAIASKMAAAASKVMAVGQWALNAAMSANPIGLVVAAIAALVAGFVIAYKHSETFRHVVQGALRAVAEAAHWMWDTVIKPAFENMARAFQTLGKAGTWLWNNALQPAFRLIVGGVSALLEMWARMLGGLAKVPGFGWARGAADAMHGAAQKAGDMADNIRKIPTSKNTDINTPGLGAATSSLRTYRSILDGLPRNVQTQILTQHTDKFTRITGQRAGGGPVRRGSTYLVGEHEPELFVPDSNGTILNGSQMRAAANRGGSGTGGGDVHITINGALDPAAVAKQVQGMLLTLKRTNGNLNLGLA